MECLHFAAFKKRAYIGLFENVSNAEEVLSRIQQAAKAEGPEGDKERELINYAFIDAELITSLLHLNVALTQSLLAEAEGRLRTKTVHSEIIWNLNPTNNITEALRRFGISKNTKSVILVQAVEESIAVETVEIQSSMESLVKGTFVPIGRLSNYTDWARVRKVYKLNEDLAVKNEKNEAILRSNIDAIVTSTVATKLVQV